MFVSPKLWGEVGITFGSAPKPANLWFFSKDMTTLSNWFKILAQVRVLIGGDCLPGTIN
jgi:hypothetical protein